MIVGASPQATWSVIAVYGVWHVTPFPLGFHAGLQTVSQDQLEAAMIDGALYGIVALLLCRI